MPRVAEPEPNGQRFPWEEWREQLVKSPTGALIFDQSDFGEMSPRRFRELARKTLKPLGVRVAVRGEEVLVERA